MKAPELTAAELVSRCDAEVGSRARGWHGCSRHAVVRAEKRSPNGDTYYLFFCRKHERKATGDRLRPSVAIVEVACEKSDV